MSMLSAQIDRLRSHADLYDGTTKPEMAKELQRPYLAQELREAADTIWELRCRLVDAEDRVRKSGELCKLCEREADNDRLRELVKSMYYDLTNMTVPPDWVTDYEADMRELGVDDG